ncbi:MAG: VOC family protein [bacterium]
MPPKASPIRPRLSHVGVYVRDLERSVRWYQEVLGMRLSDHLPPGNAEEPAAPDGIAWLRYDDVHHEVVLIGLPPEAREEGDAGGRADLQQIAFRLSSEAEVEAAFARIKESGGTILSEPRRQRVSKGLQFYFADPDGNKMELFSSDYRLPW